MDYLFSTDDCLTFLPTDGTAGPWDPSMQHGGGPASLITFLAERELAQGFEIARLTMDLLRPVPIAPLDARIVHVRDGRNISLLDLELLAVDKLVVKASVLAIQRIDPGNDFPHKTPALTLPGPREGKPAKEQVEGSSGFIKGVDLSVVRGDFGGDQPGACWFRQNRRIVEGYPASPLMKAAGIADFCNAMASEIDFTKYTFLNADLGVEFVRPPTGDWVLLDGEAWTTGKSGALSMVRLADEQGYFGLARQNLVVRPR